MSLLCPKCTNTMRQYERNDVIIDQCEECGGLFLDRGELERLAQAEANYYNPQGAVPLPPRERPRTEDRYYDDRQYDDRGRDRRYDDYTRYDDRRDDRRYDDRRYRDDKYDKYDKYGRKKRKRGSFLEDVLDILGD